MEKYKTLINELIKAIKNKKGKRNTINNKSINNRDIKLNYMVFFSYYYKFELFTILQYKVYLICIYIYNFIFLSIFVF